jgi:tetratricopeptide (TPR) repeat protein
MPRPSEWGCEYAAGMAAFSNGRYEEAIVHLKKVADGPRPEGALARFYVGQAHLRLGMKRFDQKRFAAAADHFRRATSVSPVAGGLCRYLATCYVALNRPDRAAAELAKAVGAGPDHVETRVRHALATWKSGKPRQAEAILREGLASRPEEPELLYQLATLLGSEERYDEASGLLTRCVQLAPDHSRARVRLAQCLAVLDRANEALEHLQHAQRLEPNDAMVAFQLSLLYGQAAAKAQNRPPAFRQPIIIDIDDRRAVDRLAAVIQENPEFLDSFLALPLSEVDGEVFAALLGVVQRAIEEHPEYADLRHRCSQVLQRLGRIEEAVAEAEHALAINPRYVNALIQLAQLYQATDRQVAGIIRLEQAVQLGANYPDVHYLLGQMYQARGHLEEARWAYERAVELNGRFEAARKALAALVA